MSIVRIIPANDIETFTLVTTAHRSYISSSTLGVTGSIKVRPRQSTLERDTAKSLQFNDINGLVVVDSSYDKTAESLVNKARTLRASGQPITSQAEKFVSLANAVSTRETAVLDVERFTPTTRVTKRTFQKNNVKDMLMPHYRVEYPHAHWAYTNYNSLNFFTSHSGAKQLVPDSSVLLFPNAVDADVPGQDGYVSGSYCLTGGFSFDFYINPRYTSDSSDKNSFTAGTIFHLSSSYALSLVTGSKKDYNGVAQGYRMLLQLSHSADIKPSAALPGNYPSDLVFLSEDNSLLHNNWHHVVVRWGTSTINNGTGSFVVDGVNRGNFVIPSGTIMPRKFANSLNPDVLSVGNYYEGKNLGTSAQSMFFAARTAEREGLVQLTADNLQDEPDHYTFAHPLKAELHDLSIRRHYLSDSELDYTGSFGVGIAALDKQDFVFYMPPFFVQSSPIRKYVGDHGGILQTPFFEVDGTTSDPFNIAMSFGVGGHYINLENFTKDFATGRFPRLLNLTGTAIDHTTIAREANAFLYDDGGVAKRNLTILPCDDGNFVPNYSLLAIETYSDRFTDSNGAPDYSYINLENMLTGAVALDAAGLGQLDPDSASTDAFLQTLIGPTPDNPGLVTGSAYSNAIKKIQSAIDSGDYTAGIEKGVPLTIFQRTLDPSSNQVTFFNISNLYYGRRIQPGSFMIRDASISGSYGAMSITLRDDYMGNLYRADATTTHYKQSTVGNIFYDEGIVVIKNPHLYFFGKEQYEVSFNGVQNLYTTKYEILAGSGLLNSSSNPTYIKNVDSLKPSPSPVDNEPFIYISGLNFHDENMNIVAKARLAQPVIKREGDKVLYKIAFDF
ncbi:MAG: hypothetical protein EBR82_00605 [Caulobacteraceae bacterium]|nr:hypothetical protein [Caulobacteraceae bacterium]